MVIYPKVFGQRVGIADSLLAEPRLVALDEPTIGLDPRQSAVTRKMMDRLRGEVSFILSSHILSEVEACYDRMIILARSNSCKGTLPGPYEKILAENLILKLFQMFVKSIFIKGLEKIEPKCELIVNEPVEASGKKGLCLGCNENKETVELILRKLLEVKDFEISEFQICRPDLETIFLRATKQNWQEKDLLGRRKKKSNISTSFYENDF